MRINKLLRATAVTGLALAGALAVAGTAQADESADAASCGHVFARDAEVTSVGHIIHNGHEATVFKLGESDKSWIAGPNVDVSGIDVGDTVDAEGAISCADDSRVRVLEIDES